MCVSVYTCIFDKFLLVSFLFLFYILSLYACLCSNKRGKMYGSGGWETGEDLRGSGGRWNFNENTLYGKLFSYQIKIINS